MRGTFVRYNHIVAIRSAYIYVCEPSLGKTVRVCVCVHVCVHVCWQLSKVVCE